MELYVGYAERRSAGPDVDAPTQADAGAGSPAHGVAKGSSIAICGAPVRRTVEEPWPPPSVPLCPRCRQVGRGYVPEVSRPPELS